MASYDVSGKVFFITGGAQGLGKAIADALLKRGAKVFLVDILHTKGTETLAEFSNLYGANNVAFAHADVTNRQRLEEVFAEAVRTFGYVDVIFNNAGTLDENNTRRVVQVNLLAVIEGSEIASAHMRRDKGGRGGRIINMSSIAGLEYHYHIPSYCTTKHAVRVYTTVMAQNHANEAWGLEFASLHPDAAPVGLFLDLEGKGVQDLEPILATYEGKMTSPESIVEAFIELITLEKMNGAIYFVGKDNRAFMEVPQGQEKGKTFPSTA